MANVTLEEEYHGAHPGSYIIEENGEKTPVYFSHRPGGTPQEASMKRMPQQPNTEAQQAHQKEAKSNITNANERVKAILADPEQRAAAEIRFAEDCALNGDTIKSKKTGKERKRRIEDFIRKENMRRKGSEGL